MAAAAAAPPSVDGGGLHFTIPEGTVSITRPDEDDGEDEDSWAGWEVDKTKITSVTIPTSVTSLGLFAFYGCHSLISVDIPTSVTSIGDFAFLNCRILTSLDIPTSVTSIGVFALSGCSSLTSVVIPSSVTSIGKGAFKECSSLASVEIPTSVTSIGTNAFGGCSSLKMVLLFQPGTNDEAGSAITSAKRSRDKAAKGAMDASTAENVANAESLTELSQKQKRFDFLTHQMRRAYILGTAVDKPPSAVWSRLFAPFANEDYQAEYLEHYITNPKEHAQILPDTTKIWAPDSVVAQLTGQFKDCKRFADLPRARRAAPGAKTWAGVQLWLWWLPPTSFCRADTGGGGGGGSGDGSSNNNNRVVCKARVTTIWNTMLAGSRTEKTATLPRLPEELWLYMFRFLKHEQQPTFSDVGRA